MKILVLGTRGIPDIQGGVETHCQELYPKLVELGCEVTVLTRVPYVKDKNLGEFNGVNLVPLECPTKSGLEAIVHTFKGYLYALKNKNSIDVVHIHNIGPAVFIPFLKLFGFKVVVTYHSQYYHHKKWGFIAKMLFKFGELFSAKMADKIIYLSQNIKFFVENKHDVDNGTIIYNGVNIHSKSSRSDYINSLGLETGKYCIAVGRFVEEKGFQDLIEAYKNIDTDIKLVLVGDADHENQYSLSLKKMANENSVVLTGFIKGEKLNQIFSHAKLFVMPSYHEGLPIALLEAMSYNLDVLVSDIPANIEVQLDKCDYFKVGDANDLAVKLESKLKNTSIRDFQKVIEEKYNWDLIAKQTKEVYEKVVGQ